MKSPLAALSAQLGELMLRDQQRLQRRLQGARKIKNPDALLAAAVEIESDIALALHKAQSRAATCPKITYPANLPVSQKKQDILQAIRDHQVVIVAGETGSGKTTQLPKICLELGRGVKGLIGHTQPRRLAARTVANRIADELETPLGGSVGYKVRFHDQVGENTLVKLMTDGILLAEIQQDRLLMQYDTLIIDEAVIDIITVKKSNITVQRIGFRRSHHTKARVFLRTRFEKKIIHFLIGQKCVTKNIILTEIGIKHPGTVFKIVFNQVHRINSQ